jgi:peptidyl-prolyl cis-trans isomerase SurA
MTRLIPMIASLCLALAVTALPASAQDPFAPRVVVNDRVITNFEVQQRALFLELFNTPGDLEEEAINRLIEERLQMFAAERRGIRPTEAQIADGMAEFAARADMSAEEFVATLEQLGVAFESFRDFVIAGIAWREVVRERFAGRVNITEAEIDRAMSMTAWRGATRLLLSEIVLPADPQFAAEVEQLVAQITAMTSIDAFSQAAREVSLSESAGRGGRLDWVAIENLPEPIRPMLLQMRPGQVAPPIPAGEAIILFQLRGIDRRDTLPPQDIIVEYARVLIPGAGTAAARDEIARLRAQADTCRDLAGLVPSRPEERFELVVQPLSEAPQDVALELARLDEGEISANLRTGDATRLIMLCARVPGDDLRPSRAQMAEMLTDRRVSALADGYLAELRAEAHIRHR